MADQMAPEPDKYIVTVILTPEQLRSRQWTDGDWTTYSIIEGYPGFRLQLLRDPPGFVMTPGEVPGDG